jgi:hypothetical protein
MKSEKKSDLRGNKISTYQNTWRRGEEAEMMYTHVSKCKNDK